MWRKIIMSIVIISTALAVAGTLGAIVREYNSRISPPTGARLVLKHDRHAIDTGDRTHTSGYGYFKRRDERKDGK